MILFQELCFVDLHYMFTLTGQWLRALGIWPDPRVPLKNFRRLNIRFIIATCTVSLYVSAPQIINVIRAWGNVTRVVETFSAANYSLLAVCKLFVTWYHGKSKFAFCNNIVIGYS